MIKVHPVLAMRGLFENSEARMCKNEFIGGEGVAVDYYLMNIKMRMSSYIHGCLV